MHQERLRGADEIFSSLFNHDPFLALTDGSELQRQGTRDRGQGRSHDQDFGGSMDLMMAHNPFDSINSMMRNMLMGSLSHQMNEMQGDPNGNFYSQSSVMSYSNIGNGQPKVYQATTATRQMPGGLRETRKAMRDSEAELEKMAIGRHINDRGNVITRQRNTRTGVLDENRDYFNMAEEDEPQFDNEWQEKTTNCYGNYAGRNAIGQQRDDRRTSDNRTRHHEVPAALEAAPRERRHQRHGKHK